MTQVLLLFYDAKYRIVSSVSWAQLLVKIFIVN